MQNNVGIYASQISGKLWAPAGAYDALATVTVPSGGVASVTFAGIPTGYKHLQIRLNARVTGSTTDSNIVAYFNTDTTSGNYPQHVLYGTGSSAAAGYSPSDANIAIGRTPGASSSANIFGLGIADILDYANTNKNKTVRALSGQDQNGSGIVLLNSGLWRSTAAINSITLAAQSGKGNLAQYSSFALYGVK
jgi:hypothetical protein